MKKIIVLSLLALVFACENKTSNNEASQNSTREEQISNENAPTTNTDTAAATTTSPTTAVDNETLALGQKVFNQYCFACHQSDGSGVPGMYPPIAKSDWVQGDKTRLINVLLNGLSGEIKVNGQTYNQVMPPHAFLTDEEIAAVLTYIRHDFGNNADPVSVAEVTALRKGK